MTNGTGTTMKSADHYLLTLCMVYPIEIVGASTSVWAVSSFLLTIGDYDKIMKNGAAYVRPGPDL